MSVNDSVYVYPTDTVWGIGGSIYSEVCYWQIVKIKKMESSKPSSILFSDVEMLFDYFSFPENVSLQQLKTLFSFELTLALPMSWAKKEIPEWITRGSDLVCVRCLDLPAVYRIIQETNSPIITTSLNYSGDKEILEKSEAIAFCEGREENLCFIEDDTAGLSGFPSSILVFDNLKNIRFIRRGRFEAEIKDYCRLFST